MALGFRCCCDETGVPCTNCSTGKGPLCWKATVVNDDAATFNGVYYIPLDPSASPCRWRCRNGAPFSSGVSMLSTVSLFQEEGDHFLQAQFSSGLVATYRKSSSSPINCNQSHELVGASGTNGTCLLEPLNDLSEIPCNCFGPGTAGECFCTKCRTCAPGTDKNITGFQVVVEGLEDGTSCNGSELNGTYIFDWPWDNTNDEPADPTQDEGHDEQGCHGRTIDVSGEVECSCGSNFPLEARFLISSSSRLVRLEIHGESFPFFTSYVWSRVMPAAILGTMDCSAINVTLDAGDLGNTSDNCGVFDASSATITITPITE